MLFVINNSLIKSKAFFHKFIKWITLVNTMFTKKASKRINFLEKAIFVCYNYHRS